MAGTSLALSDLALRGTLSGRIAAYLQAGTVTCGPWIFTVLALAGVGLFHRSPEDTDSITLFTIVIIYNFVFSLVLASPIVLVVTRCISDNIYTGNVELLPGMLVGALALLFAFQAMVAIPYYGFVVELTVPERLLAITSFFTAGGIWIAAAFLTVRRSFYTISAAFAFGMTVAFLMGIAPWVERAADMLIAFTLGLAIVFFMLLGKILADYPYPMQTPWKVFSAFRRYWEFALIGLFFAAGLWVDKWIMWSAPGNQIFAGAMPAHPAYDAAMFLAFLSLIPALTVFFVCMETQFIQEYRKFYSDIGKHATFNEITRNHLSIINVLKYSSRRVVIIQSTVSYVLIVIAPNIVQMAAGGIEMVPILRFALLGVLFNAMVFCIMAVLSYFDQRRLLLRISVLFFLLNAGLTVAALPLGSRYYGYGYLAASIFCSIYAYFATTQSLMRLPYVTFIANNKGLH